MGMVMRRITEIEQTNETCITVTLDNGEVGVVYKFAGGIYSTVSEYLHKSTLAEFKKSCLEFDFDTEQLRKKYLYEE